MADPSFGQELEHAWDALRRGQSIPGHLDPTLIDTVRRLHALDRVMAPDPDFVHHVREELMSAGMLPVAPAPDVRRAPNGRDLIRPPWLWRPVGPGSPHHRSWALTQAATAALLLLVLGGAFFLFGPGRLGHHEPTLIAIPAIVGAPIPTPDANGNITTILIQQVAEEGPEWLYLQGINQSTTQPGGVSGLSTYGGPVVHYIVSGTLTITSDHPTTVARGPAGTNATHPDILPAGTEVVVNAGDTAIIPYGAKAITRNDGNVPIVWIAGVAEGPEDVSAFGTGFDMRSWPTRQAGALPKAPALVTYSHVVMTPGARFGHFDGPGWQVYGAAPEQWNQLRGQADGSEINVGQTPVDVYVLSIMPLPFATTPSPGATPGAPAPDATANSVATPESGVTVTPLGSGTVDALPAEPSWLMTFHSTFRPGGRYSMELSEGPDLIAVRSGAMTYHADQPITVLRAVTGAGPRAREVIPPDTDAVLQAGDAAVIPMGANVSRRNDGAEPAVEIMAMLEGTFLGSRGRGAPTSVVDLPIVTFHISDAHTLPAAPATITLSQVTLAPGARLTSPVVEWWMIGASEEAYANLEQQQDGTVVNGGSVPIDLYLTTVESSSGGTAMP